MEQINILVTGVGAIIGQGIIKSLKSAKFDIRIIGLDLNPEAFGKHWCHQFYIKPSGNENSDYLQFILHVIEKENIVLVFPGIEVDVNFFQLNFEFFKQHSKAIIILNNLNLISVSNDKWTTHQTLQTNGFKTIPTLIDGTWNDCLQNLGLPPFLLKPRTGNGSRGIYKLHNEADFHYWKAKYKEQFMVQQYVGTDNEEYTVGVFGLADKKAGKPIILKRLLSPSGFTQFAEVVENENLEKLIEELNDLFCPEGPTNYQFRKHNNEFLLLEVNPRFSSSVSLKAGFGFNEAEMCINYYLYNRLPGDIQIKKGKAIRFIEDFFI